MPASSTDLADRSADTLSGGEIARVHFARAIAAHAPLLIADEPTAALDPLHQLAIASCSCEISSMLAAAPWSCCMMSRLPLATRIA